MRRDCPMRHENGNCTVAGGFCTAVNDQICEALHNAYDCGQRMPQKWISVEDELPSCDERVLCRYVFRNTGICFYQVLDYYATDKLPHFQHELAGDGMKVTHWMPLPRTEGLE